MKFYTDQREVPHKSQAFHEMVDVCGLYDLGFEGRSWTFEKKVAGGSYIYVCMDRVVFSRLECHVPCRFDETPLIGCLRPYSYLIVVELEKGTTTSQGTL